MKKQTFLIALSLLLASCKSPFDRTKDASGGGATGTLTGNANLVVFNSELVTGGGAFEYPSGDNQSLIFSDMSNPISHRSIRYSWNGGPPKAGVADHTFAGFDLMHVVDNTVSLSVYAATRGRDLRPAGYTHVSFYARGTLSSRTALKIEVADDGNSGTAAPCLTLSTGTTDVCSDNGPNPLAMMPQVLTSSWLPYTITILVPNTSLASVKDFFKATFVYSDPLPGVAGQAPGQGGTVYFDMIEYKP